MGSVGFTWKAFTSPPDKQNSRPMAAAARTCQGAGKKRTPVYHRERERQRALTAIRQLCESTESFRAWAMAIKTQGRVMACQMPTMHSTAAASNVKDIIHQAWLYHSGRSSSFMSLITRDLVGRNIATARFETGTRSGQGLKAQTRGIHPVHLRSASTCDSANFPGVRIRHWAARPKMSMLGVIEDIVVTEIIMNTILRAALQGKSQKLQAGCKMSRTPTTTCFWSRSPSAPVPAPGSPKKGESPPQVRFC